MRFFKKTLSQFFFLVLASACSSQNSIPADKYLFFEKIDSGLSISLNYKYDIKDVVIPDTFDQMPITAITAEGFKNSDIETVVFGNNVTEVGYNSFANCERLQRIVFNEKLKIINSSPFSGCSSLKYIVFPTDLEILHSSCFYGCTSLETIQLPKNVYSIDYHCFARCPNLKSFSLNESNGNFSINDGVIFNDSGDVLYLFPNGKTSNYTIPENVKIIREGAFYTCQSIETITISEEVKYLGDECFAFCDKLSSISYLGTIAEWNEIYKGVNWVTSSIKITCKDGTIEL